MMLLLFSIQRKPMQKSVQPMEGISFGIGELKAFCCSVAVAIWVAPGEKMKSTAKKDLIKNFH